MTYTDWTMELQCYENQTENRTRLRTQLNQKKFILAVEFGYNRKSWITTKK